MIPYLEKLNAIPGVCSQFCCSGHNDVGDMSGNIVFFTSLRVVNILSKQWINISEWPETNGIMIGISGETIRWTFRWKVNKEKSYYQEFMTKLIELLDNGVKNYELSPVEKFLKKYVEKNNLDVSGSGTIE